MRQKCKVPTSQPAWICINYQESWFKLYLFIINDILPLIPILESQGIFVTDWNSNKLNLKEDFQYKYSTIVSRNNNIYNSAVTLLK